MVPDAAAFPAHEAIEVKNENRPPQRAFRFVSEGG